MVGEVYNVVDMTVEDGRCRANSFQKLNREHEGRGSALEKVGRVLGDWELCAGKVRRCACM
jgi:hypothetical protein